MNQPNHVISENLVISQPLYDNDLAAQSIYDKYLKDCTLMPNRLIEESKETQERPFAGTRPNSQQQQNQRNDQIIQEISSQEREQRNRNQQQIQQANYQQDQQYQNNQMRYPQQNIYYHQRQFNQFQNYHHDQHHYYQHRRNQQNYRMEQEYYGHQLRRQEQGRRRQQQQPKYGLDLNEIAALSEIVFRQSRASCWDDENKKCSICISHFEENEKIRFLPCLHRYYYELIIDFIQVASILGWPPKDHVHYVKSMSGPQFNNFHETHTIYIIITSTQLIIRINNY